MSKGYHFVHFAVFFLLVFLISAPSFSAEKKSEPLTLREAERLVIEIADGISYLQKCENTFEVNHLRLLIEKSFLDVLLDEKKWPKRFTEPEKMVKQAAGFSAALSIYLFYEFYAKSDSFHFEISSESVAQFAMIYAGSFFASLSSLGASKEFREQRMYGSPIEYLTYLLQVRLQQNRIHMSAGAGVFKLGHGDQEKYALEWLRKIHKAYLSSTSLSCEQKLTKPVRTRYGPIH